MDVTLEVKGLDTILRSLKVLKTFSYFYSQQAMDKASEKLIDKVELGIKKQTFNHLPLSPSYLAWKIEKGLDKRILMATRTYVNELEPPKPKAKIMSLGSDLPGTDSWKVGPPGGIHSPSGLSFEELAARLEFGVMKEKLPPRPHWRPSFEEVAKEFPQQVKWVATKTGRVYRSSIRR